MPGDSKDLGVIRRCRDLVQLYYGLRFAVGIAENVWFNTAAAQQLMQPDPRRIRYEIVLSNQDPAADLVVFLGSSEEFVNTAGIQYTVKAGETLVIERTFLTDADNVTLPVWGLWALAAAQVSTRETFLTPLPVDET